MRQLQMSEVCELFTCSSCGDREIIPTGTFTWSVRHDCGEWTPQDGICCAYCGEPLEPADDEDDGGEEDHDQDGCPAPCGMHDFMN